MPFNLLNFEFWANVQPIPFVWHTYDEQMDWFLMQDNWQDMDNKVAV